MTYLSQRQRTKSLNTRYQMVFPWFSGYFPDKDSPAVRNKLTQKCQTYMVYNTYIRVSTKYSISQLECIYILIVYPPIKTGQQRRRKNINLVATRASVALCRSNKIYMALWRGNEYTLPVPRPSVWRVSITRSTGKLLLRLEWHTWPIVKKI